MAYTYKQTEFSPYQLWTVGSYDSGKCEPESDHNTKEQAANRAIVLNGGTPESQSSHTDAEIETMQNSINWASKIMDENKLEIERLKGLIEGLWWEHAFRGKPHHERLWQLFKLEHNL